MTAEIAVPDHTPEVTTLFEMPTPDIEEKLVEDVHKLPPMPTPPVTVKVPEEVEVEAVEAGIETLPLLLILINNVPRSNLAG